MSRSVVVIGAGIIGLCCAEALARRGCKVTVIDRDLRERGCSFGNGGIIVPSHFVPLASPGMLKKGLAMLLDSKSPFGFSKFPDLETLAWTVRFLRSATRRNVERASPVLLKLNLASRAAYEELIPRLGTAVGYAQRGCLMLCKSEHAFREEAALGGTARALGLSVKELRGADLLQAEPELPMSVYGGVLFEQDAHLSPPLFMEALRSHLDRLGVCLVQGTVSGFKKAADRLEAVKASDGDLEADEFVVAAGAWSGRLARDLGLSLPLLSGRGYGFEVEGPPVRPQRAGILVEARIAVTPMPDGIRFVGAMELGPPADGIRSSRVEGMRMNIPSYFPTLDEGLLARSEAWFGHRPCSPDGVPYLGRTARFRNVSFATGHAMMGMSLGPVSGNIVAQTICGEPLEVSSELLSPDRFD
jgi:D-amino-acid dehydrogenase